MEGREREDPRSKRLSGLQEEVRRLRLEVGALRSTIDWAREAIEEFDQVPPGQDKYQEMRLIRFLGHMEARIGRPWRWGLARITEKQNPRSNGSWGR